MNRYQMLIDGEWVDAEGGETFEFDNPFLGAGLGARAARPSLPTSIARWRGGAPQAFRAPSWGGISASARGALLRRLADLIAAEADRLATIETRDNGKLITEMRAQLRYIPQWFTYFGGLADKIEGRLIPIDKPGMVEFHARGAARRGRGDHAVEFAAHAGDLEARAGAGRRQHGRLEALGVLVRVGARVWTPVREGRLSSRRREHPDRALARRSASVSSRIPHVAKVAFTGGDRTTGRASMSLLRPIDQTGHVREGLGPALRLESTGRAQPHLYRSAPCARSHLASGLSGFARTGPESAASGSYHRDDRPQYSDHRPIAAHS